MSATIRRRETMLQTSSSAVRASDAAAHRMLLVSIISIAVLVSAIAAFEWYAQARINAAEFRALETTRLIRQQLAATAEVRVAARSAAETGSVAWIDDASTWLPLLARPVQEIARSADNELASELRSLLALIGATVTAADQQQNAAGNVLPSAESSGSAQLVVERLDALSALSRQVLDTQRTWQTTLRRQIEWQRTLLVVLGLLVVALSVFRAFDRLRRAQRGMADQMRLIEPLDPLTGLDNRNTFARALDDRVSTARADEAKSDPLRMSHHIMLFDLTGFREINETYGHEAGDAVLKAVSRRLIDKFADASVSRVGADEFAVISTARQSADAVLDQTQDAAATIGKPFVFKGVTIPLRVAAGIAPLTARHDRDAVLRNVKLALSIAKRTAGSGEGNVQLFTSSMDENRQASIDLERRIAAALADGLFVPFFQPIVDLSTGRIVGAEALARWPRVDGSVLPPNVFLPKLEEMGRIDELTWLILAKACAIARHWPADMILSVNVPPVQLSGPFAERVLSVLEYHGVAPERLQIEVLETALAAGGGDASLALSRLREAGVRIALDDFGVGYSSLGQLSRLPVDKIKIDRSFVSAVDQIITDNGSEPMPRRFVGTAVVRAAVELGTAFGLDVVAEGIETPEQIASLRTLGCTFGQGYYWSKPMDSNAFKTYLTDHVSNDDPLPAVRKPEQPPAHVAA